MSRTPLRFALGDRARFSDTVKKVRDEQRTVTWESAGLPERESYSLDENRAWERHIRKFTEGIVVGQRFLADYTVYTETDYGEYGVSYGSYTVSSQIPGTSRRAWLVSYDLHRKPALVLDEHIEKLHAPDPLNDIGFLWDWRINRGQPFLANAEDVPIMRLLLKGTPIEEISQFAWIALYEDED